MGRSEQAGTRAGGCRAGNCGVGGEQGEAGAEHLRLRVQDHPCYSEQAHRHFARLHLAVAPGCNIQCNYCNRKFDCANESRPGVVSALLTPDQAVRKTLAVATAIPQLSVLGIAGPGDALANPRRTFATFGQLARLAPDLKLCLSTNGLALPEHVEQLVRLKVDHVTITINCIDPEIGAQIYPWIVWDRRRVFGREAAAILIARQQRGLELLVAAGILVKINSVLIPGVNDAHLPEVSRLVKAKGAFLHNVMPLISDPRHGTHYGLSGQRGPTPEELQALQDACAGDMKMMRHCRQCRADAVGLLGEDRGAEFSMDKIATMDLDWEVARRQRLAVRSAILAELERERRPPSQVVSFQPRPQKAPGRPVRMAVAAKNGLIATHFGHAREFLVYEVSAAAVRLLETRPAGRYCGGREDCGEEEQAAILDKTIAALADCEAVLCARIGYEPWQRLKAAGLEPDGEHAMEPVAEAVLAVWQRMLAAGKLDPPLAAAC